MDVVALSMALSQSTVKQQAQLSIINKIMDQATTNSYRLMKIMQQSRVTELQRSVQSHLGSSVDVEA